MRTLRSFILIFLCILVLSACRKDERGMVVGRIHQASKLATTEFTIDKIVHGTKSKKLAWFVNLNDARFLAYSRAIIKTGVDLEKVHEEDIAINGDYISIELPEVEVINFSYPPKYFELDKNVTDNAFLNKISIYDQERFFRDAEIDIRNNLKYMGIVESTEGKTRLLLTEMLKTLGYTDIRITFREGQLIDEIPFTEQFNQ